MGGEFCNNVREIKYYFNIWGIREKKKEGDSEKRGDENSPISPPLDPRLQPTTFRCFWFSFPFALSRCFRFFHNFSCLGEYKALKRIYTRFVQNVKIVKPTFSMRRHDIRTTSWACTICHLYDDWLLDLSNCSCVNSPRTQTFFPLSLCSALTNCFQRNQVTAGNTSAFKGQCINCRK